jgi:hypothetical protein
MKFDSFDGAWAPANITDRNAKVMEKAGACWL